MFAHVASTILFGAVGLDLLLARLALAERHQQDVLLVQCRQEISPPTCK